MAAKKRMSSEDDSYWEASSASTIKSKGINVFDESVGFEETKKILQQSLFDDDEEDADTVNWDGSSVSFSAAASVKSDPRLSRNLHPGQNIAPSGSSSAGASRHVLASDISARAGNLSIDDVVSRPKPEPTSADIMKLEAEINFLKRSLHSAKKEKFSQIPPQATVLRMIHGQPFTLEMYKAKEDKLALVDEAIRLHDGNAIINTLLFLQSTVKPAIFHQALQQRPVAVQQYITYLKSCCHTEKDFDKLIDFLCFFGRNEEAAMLAYKKAMSVFDASSKIDKLKKYLRSHFQDPRLSLEAGLLQEQISLLERQRPIEENDIQDERKGVQIFREMPRKKSIIGLPALTTLFYCCIYHYDKEEKFLASPIGIKNTHKLTDRQFVWTAMRARGLLKQWADIEVLFQTKGWLGGTKMKAIVPFDRVVVILKHLVAPRQVLNKYCNLIDDQDRRLEIGEKCGCHESVLETFLAQKDRVQVQKYQARLPSNSQEWFFASDILRNSSIKWKN